MAKVVGAIVTPNGAKAQTVTLARQPERIEEVWRDPDRLSVLLGEIAGVEAIGPDRYRWRLVDGPAWEARLAVEPGRIGYAGTGDDNQIVVDYRPAPNDLGSEVTTRVKSPASGDCCRAQPHTRCFTGCAR